MARKIYYFNDSNFYRQRNSGNFSLIFNLSRFKIFSSFPTNLSYDWKKTAWKLPMCRYLYNFILTHKLGSWQSVVVFNCPSLLILVALSSKAVCIVSPDWIWHPSTGGDGMLGICIYEIILFKSKIIVPLVRWKMNLYTQFHKCCDIQVKVMSNKESTAFLYHIR